MFPKNSFQESRGLPLPWNDLYQEMVWLSNTPWSGQVFLDLDFWLITKLAMCVGDEHLSDTFENIWDGEGRGEQLLDVTDRVPCECEIDDVNEWTFDDDITVGIDVLVLPKTQRAGVVSGS